MNRTRIVAISMILSLAGVWPGCQRKETDEFSRFSNLGRTYYEKGEAQKAVDAFEKAVKAQPSHPDAQLNLANAYLLANEPAKAITQAQSVLEGDHNSAAAYYIIGCA